MPFVFSLIPERVSLVLLETLDCLPILNRLAGYESSAPKEFGMLGQVVGLAEVACILDVLGWRGALLQMSVPMSDKKSSHMRSLAKHTLSGFSTMLSATEDRRRPVGSGSEPS